MSDIVDLTYEGFFPSEKSPYGNGPFRRPNHLCILGKTDSGLFFVSFLPSVPPYKAQRWSLQRGDAKRFEDSRIAGEFAKLADAMPDCKPGESLVLFVEEGNPNPTRFSGARSVVPEAGMSAKKWLTTYSGKGF
jgi:hypothetical protein